jgi:hypothetical protein
LSGWKDRIGQPEHNFRFTIWACCLIAQGFPWLQFDAFGSGARILRDRLGDGVALV